MNLEGVRIVLAGDEKFLGRHIRDRLLAIGAAPVFLLGDYNLTHAPDVFRMYDELAPKIVVHVIPGDSTARAAHSAMTTSLNLIEHTRGQKLHKYVQVAPVGVYTNALIAMLHAYRRDYNLNGISLMWSGVYGPGGNGIIAGLVRAFCEANKRNQKEVLLWGPKAAANDFLYAKDLARGVVQALQDYDKAEPLIFRSGQEVTIRALAEHIKDLTEYVGEVRWNGPHPHYPEGVYTKAAEEVLDFQVHTPLEEGLRKTIQWYRREK